ncbi:hypothetical protein, partial [Mycobacterium gordonae]|uniref:hypothetical protein n=1 Tax=Mycobacterium gordonae TaxID=1778 RepID=UPI000B1AE06B
LSFDDLAVSKQNLRPAPFTPALGRDRLVLMNGAYPTELAELTALTRKYADDLQPGPTGSDDTPARAVETGAIFMTRDLSGARPGSNAAAMYPFGPPQRPAENIRAYAKLLLSQADNALDLSKLPYVPGVCCTIR